MVNPLASARRTFERLALCRRVGGRQESAAAPVGASPSVRDKRDSPFTSLQPGRLDGGLA
jgi:hypothetical protein